jgi:esterase/lipase superfamily enzyme
VVALESFHGCLLASCAAPPSSWATEDDPSYTISFNLFFARTRNPSSNQYCPQMI